jgi:uncharacterized protein YaeQ
MALKATIFKVELQISDLDRHYYQAHTLTIARHPSETDERMMVRIVAFACHAHAALEFGKGLSAEDEPDLWRKDLTGAVEQWLEVGLPDAKRLRKATGRARAVIVYTYGGRSSELWWEQNRAALHKLDKLSVIDLPAEQTQALAKAATRTMQINATVQEGELWLTIHGQHDQSLHVAPLRRQ